MIIDAFNEFSAGQAVTATALSTNVIDLGPTQSGQRRDIGNGEEMWLVVQTNVAATDAGNDATLAVTLESADNEAISTNATVHYTTGALAFADFSPARTALAVIRIPNALYRRYLAVRFTVASGPLTGGTFSAALVKDPQAYRSYLNNAPIAAIA
jgi:hypothetical protein